MDWFLATALVYLLSSSVLGAQPVIENDKILWQKGDLGVPSYRIPLVSYTPKGNLIVVAEGRRSGSSDIGPKYLVMRRSTDKGNTWSESEIFLTDDSPDGMNLGSILVDDVTGVIHLLAVRCAHYYKCKTSEMYQLTSEDDGKTWSDPKSLNKYLGSKMFSPGPGTGFQKKYFPNKGRLVACGHSTISGNGMFMVISDDHGATWRYAGGIKSIPFEQNKRGGDFVPDECQPFEMDDGSIVVNIRNQNHYHCHCRMIARSYDGGETFDWENLYFDEKLVDPAVCAGANIQNGILYFSNPNNPSSRQNLQLTWSYDQGKTWEEKRLVVWKDKAAYSVISVSPSDKDHIFMVLERGMTSDIDEIAFHSINIKGMKEFPQRNVTHFYK